MKQHTALHNALKERGHRITRARSVLLHLFSNTDGPLSAAAIALKLNQMGITPNKTTIYRELEFLVQQNLVQELRLKPGKKHYELRAAHHHHVICKKCGKVEEIALSKLETFLPATEEKIQQKTGFKSLDHALEFFGICKTCS